MSTKHTTTVEDAHTDIREHAQAIIGDLGSLAHESSGGNEVRDNLAKAAKLTVSLDASIRDVQQALATAQGNISRLAEKVDEANEQWRALAKTTDIVKISTGQLGGDTFPHH